MMRSTVPISAMSDLRGLISQQGGLWKIYVAYNGGPLAGPDLFRKFAFRHYRRVCHWLHSQGIGHIGLDIDGNIT